MGKLHFRKQLTRALKNKSFPKLIKEYIKMKKENFYLINHKLQMIFK